MKFPTLYKRTSTGAIQQWTMEVEGNKFRTISGQVNGKLVTSEWTECFGKNIGRANATTDSEQAMAEATSRFTKQKEKHYYENVKDIDKDKYLKVMLAKKFEDYEHKLPDVVYSQPKLDGCVSGDTIVETEKGLRKIKDVVAGNDEFILSYNVERHKKEMKHINGKFRNADDIQVQTELKWMKFELDNGTTITVTDNHRFYLPALGIWRMAKDIEEGDDFLVST